MLRKTWVSLYDNCKLVFIYEKDLSTSVQGPEETAVPCTQRFVGSKNDKCSYRLFFPFSLCILSI